MTQRIPSRYCFQFAFAAALTVPWLGLVSGCSKPASNNTSVSGEVALDGAPLASGTITFQSTYGGQTSIGTISNGKYVIPVDQGPFPGDQTVRIMAFRDAVVNAVTATTDMPVSAPPKSAQEQYLPAKYNTATELKTTLAVGTTNEKINFDLTSK